MRYKLVVLIVGLILTGCSDNREEITSSSPDVDFTYSPEAPMEGDEITFEGKVNEGSSEIISWAWNFGDEAESTAEGKTATFTYKNAGSYDVTLSVSDDNGNSTTSNSTVTVEAPSEPEPSRYSTQDAVEEDIAEIHSLIRSSGYYGYNFTLMTALSSDIVTLTEKGSAEHAALQHFDTYQLQADSPVLESYWNTSFKAIQEADTLIEYLPEAELNEGFIEASLGEVEFLKALVYFDLARSFGGMPLENIGDEPGEPARASEEETYTYIIDLLQRSISKLPPFSRSSSVSREAAEALLARCFMYLGQWHEAVDVASNIVNTGAFTLAGEYESVFENSDDGEIIYQIELDNDLLASWYKPESEGGQQKLALHQQFASEMTGREADNRNILVDTYTSGEQSVYYSTKFAQSTGSTYLPIFRLSQVYLTQAEAFVQIGQIPQATEILNMVRMRAGLEPVAPGMSGEELMQAIARERSVELLGEGHRWFDIARTGSEGVLKELSENNQYSFQEYKLHFPIPFSVIDDNPNIHQNPGY